MTETKFGSIETDTYIGNSIRCKVFTEQISPTAIINILLSKYITIDIRRIVLQQHAYKKKYLDDEG